MADNMFASLADGCRNLWSGLSQQAAATPLAEAADRSAAVAEKQVTAPDREAGELECPCENKWLVITITRHTKHNFNNRWDCTVGDLKMELWETEDAGSGSLVFECQTSERGGPGVAAFSSSSNGPNYAYYNQYMIVARETYGLAPHNTGNYKTYNYSTSYLTKPRPGIAVYGTGSGAMDKRTGVLIHAGTSHTWSVGCIVVHRDGAVSNGAYRFDKDVSANALLDMFEKIHSFTGQSKMPVGARIARVRLRILENFGA